MLDSVGRLIYTSVWDVFKGFGTFVFTLQDIHEEERLAVL